MWERKVKKEKLVSFHLDLFQNWNDWAMLKLLMFTRKWLVQRTDQKTKQVNIN